MRLFILAFFLISRTAISQGSLEDIVGSSSEKSRPISSTFSSTRIVNGHSVEMIPKGVGEFRISHRFGTIEEGFYDIFGLDNAHEMAYPVPSVRSGPKARKIANSPSPRLATSLRGLAV